MIFKIEEIPGYRIAYMRKVGPYGADNKDLMERLKSWAMSENLIHDSAIILGIAQDDPAVTLPENCRYDACIVIPKEFVMKDEDTSVNEFPGGRYAVFTVAHTAQEIQKAWNEIFPELADQGYQMDTARPILERYIPSMVKKHLCEICVPVY